MTAEPRPKHCQLARIAAVVLALALSCGRIAAQGDVPLPSGAGKIPPPPAEPIAAEVYRALRTHCARCHQRGVVQGPMPSGGFGNVLVLGELAGDPHFVQAGNPDASRLLAYLLDPLHPLDGAGEAASSASPSAAGAAAMHEWIGGLPRRDGSCRGRAKVAPRDVAAAIERWQGVFGRETARDTRFVTLAHLHNDCASDQELRAYRMAVDKILNSLSWREAPVRTRAIDGTRSVLAVRLGELGWDAAKWDALAALEPPGIGPQLPPAVSRVAGAGRPAIRADWLAEAALRPPAYYELLGVPGQLDGLERHLGIEGDVSRRAPIHAVLRASPVTGGARIAERLATAHGPAWFVRDYAAGTRGEDALGPASGTGVTTGNAPAGGPDGFRAIFALPNGFLGFAIFAPDGRRRERIAQELDHLSTVKFGPSYAGRSCLGCHAGGVVPFPAGSSGSGPAPDAGWPELAPAFDADRRRYRSALIRAGIDPDLSLHGLGIVEALARRYDTDVGLGRAAAELGLDDAGLSQRLEATHGGEQRLAIRLRQGLLSRGEANLLLARLANVDPLGMLKATPGVAPHGGADRIRLLLWSDKLDYRVGDRPRFEVETSAPCYVTIIGVNPRGNATVLFPNDFEPENKIEPGTPLRIPAASSPYNLRFTETGRETIVAICETDSRPPAAIAHNWVQQRFTILGAWRGFPVSASALAANRPRLTRRRRERQQEHGVDQTPSGQDPGLAAGRTAIVVEVRD